MSSTLAGTPCYGWQLTDVMSRIVTRFNSVLSLGGSTDTWVGLGHDEWTVYLPGVGLESIGYTPSTTAANGAYIGVGNITDLRDGLAALYSIGFNPGYSWTALPTDWTTGKPIGLTGSTVSIYYRAIGSTWTGTTTWVHPSTGLSTGMAAYDVDYLELAACLSWMEDSIVA